MSNTQQENRSYRTAITRKVMSAPTKFLIENGNLSKSDYILDYGCGKGGDVQLLIEKGYEAEGYDPYWQPIEPADGVLYDKIICQYVLNVLVTDDEVRDVIEKVKARLKPNGSAYFTVRRDLGKHVGWTSRGTYQQTVKLDTKEFNVVVSKAGNYIIYEYVNVSGDGLKP